MDTIYEYESLKDVIHLKTGNLISLRKDGSDAILTYGNNDKLTIKGAAGMGFKIADNNGAIATYYASSASSKMSLSYLYDNKMVSSASSSVASLSLANAGVSTLASQTYASSLSSEHKLKSL